MTKARGGVVWAVAMLLAPIVLLTSGCSGGGTLEVQGRFDSSVNITGRFDRGVFSRDGKQVVDVVLIEGSAENPMRLAHLRMHWRPAAGRTPVARQSTNTTVRYVLFDGDTVALYSGAGFLFPLTGPDDQTFRGELRDTALRLEDSTEDFVDDLGLAEATGGITAEYDPLTAQRLMTVVERRLRDRLGYPRLIQSDSAPAPLAEAR